MYRMTATQWGLTTITMISDVEKMIFVGLIWGTTNSLMRRGALVWEQKLRSSPAPPPSRPALLTHLLKWVRLLLTWHYSLPFLLNLSASASFFHLLSAVPISRAVPVTNAVTFAATAVSAAALGEEFRLGPAVFGTALILLGVWICVT